MIFFLRTELMKASKRHKCRRPKKSAKNDNERSLARACWERSRISTPRSKQLHEARRRTRTSGWLSACVTSDWTFLRGDSGVEFDELRHDTTCRFQNHEHGGDVQEQQSLHLWKPFASKEGHHEELHHTQTISGNVEALVELHQVLRVAKQPSPPQPASGAPEEKAQVLHQDRRKRPRPRTLPHDLGSVHIARTKPAASDATPAENTQDTGERVLNISPHGALGCLALTSATLVASTPSSSSGNSRLGDGGRGASETVCVKERVPFVIGVGRRLRSTGGLRSRSCGSGGSRGNGGWLRFCRGSLEYTSNTWEAQLGRWDWRATLGGQARDQSRLREGNRATQTRSNTGAAAWRPWSAFRQRRRWPRASARHGRGGPEWRGVQQRGRHLMTGRGRWSRRCGRCRSCRNQRRAWSWRSSTTTWTGWFHDSGEAHSDGVLECGQHWELGRELTKLITTGHVATESTNQRGQRAKGALWARNNESWKCSGQWGTETQPLGRQDGKPPWAALAKAQSRRATGDRETMVQRRQSQKTRNRNEGQQRRARRDSRPPAGARHPDPGPPEEQSSANRREPGVLSVARSQELCWSAACERQPRPKRRCVCAQWIC